MSLALQLFFRSARWGLNPSEFLGYPLCFYKHFSCKSGRYCVFLKENGAKTAKKWKKVWWKTNKALLLSPVRNYLYSKREKK